MTPADASSPNAPSSPLFDYPSAAAFGQNLPKSKIYAFAKPSNRVKKLFTDEVAQIVWKYKLAPETVRLAERPGVPEIQIFVIALKDPGADGLSEDVLRCIDKAIAFPIFYEVSAGDRTRATAAFKRPSEAAGEKWVVGDYFASPWMPSSAPRSPLPVALDLGALYAQMLRRLMPWPPREGETLREQAERIARIRTLEKECHTLEARIRREKQFNRKVENNSRLHSVRDELERLTG